MYLCVARFTLCYDDDDDAMPFEEQPQRWNILLFIFTIIFGCHERGKQRPRALGFKVKHQCVSAMCAYWNEEPAQPE